MANGKIEASGSKIPETGLPKATPDDIKRVAGESEKIATARALEEIDKLPSELKVIADKGLSLGYTPIEALTEINIIYEIDMYSSPDFKKIFDLLLKQGMMPSEIMYIVKNEANRKRIQYWCVK